MSTATSPLGSPLARVAQRRRSLPPQERCELCAAPIEAAHPHLLDTATRTVRCACRACALLFDRAAASNGALRRIPDRRRELAAEATAALWERLPVPVGVAFLTVDDDLGPGVDYPGPAGLTRADLGPLDWAELVALAPDVAPLEPHVEAVLLRRRAGQASGFVVPIDDCFRFVAVMRQGWVGINGGDEAAHREDRWFGELAARIPTDRRSRWNS